MKVNFFNLKVIVVILALCCFCLPAAYTQSKSSGSAKKKTTSSKSSTAQGNKNSKTGNQQGKNTGTKSQTGKSGSKSAGKDAPKPGALPADQIDPLREQAGQIVKFYESTLNFLADKKNSVQDKQVIIGESYLKFFWDSEVQIEDDLDEHLVPFPKDVQAYLADVDFFFKRAKFTYNVQDISVMTNDLGNTFFKVTCMRSLGGLTLNGDSVNNNKVRYIEINFDEGKQQLKIVSIYTTKINENDDMRNWWNLLSSGWQGKLGGSIQLGNGLTLASVASYNDTAAMVGGKPVTIDQDAYYKGLTQIMGLKKLDLSGDVTISDLSPISKLSALQEVNLSGTPVSDLMPLRNLNNLQTLNISNTNVASLEPLHYCTHIRQLVLKGSNVADLSLLVNFPELEDLDISNTKVKSLDPVKDLVMIDDLRLANTMVADLAPVAALVRMEILNISSTPVKSLEPLKGMDKLKILLADSTGVSSLAPIDNLPALQKVYCDYSGIPKNEAINFMVKHPQVSLVFESPELAKWWAGMSPDFQSLLSHFTDIGKTPTKEQLHKLILVDSLNLSGRMNVKSLEPVAMLSLLRILLASSTGVIDISPLKNLGKLQVLQLNNTGVTSLQPLGTLTSLSILSIENTQVADLSPLYGMTSLKTVFADNSQVVLREANAFLDKNPACMLLFQTFENNSWWKGLPKAWQEVFMTAAGIKTAPDKFQLQQIAGMDKLSFSENVSIVELTPLLKLSRLTELSFTGTSVTSLEPIRNMDKLTSLNCAKNPIEDLSPLAGLVNLKSLDFSNTLVEELMPIQNLSELEVLKFSGSKVKRLKYLANLKNIRVLEMYNTKITSLDEVEEMKNLESLKIFKTNLSPKRVERFKQTHPKCEVAFYK